MYKYFHISRSDNDKISMVYGLGHTPYTKISDRLYDASGGPLLKNLDSLTVYVGSVLFGYGELFGEIFK